MIWKSVLCLLVASTSWGCTDPLAERCDIDDDCASGEVCSNDGDRRHPGYCEPAPEPEEEETTAAMRLTGGADHV